MRHHFHHCPYLRVLAVAAEELSGERHGGRAVLEELCEARHLARCVGLVECGVLSLPEKRRLLVSRATRLREEEPRPAPLAGPDDERRDALEMLREGLEAERDEIVARNRRLEAEGAFLDDAGGQAEGEAELADAGVTPHLDATLRELDTERLDLLDRALHAIPGRDYGLCAACGGWVELERLRRVPDTRVCGGCAKAAGPVA